jgi:hypothetical protein
LAQAQPVRFTPRAVALVLTFGSLGSALKKAKAFPQEAQAALAGVAGPLAELD